MPKLSDFLQELAKPQAQESSVRDLWHTRDREDAMTEFGLEEYQKEAIRRALETEDLTEVQGICATEQQGETSTHVFLWVK